MLGKFQVHQVLLHALSHSQPPTQRHSHNQLVFCIICGSEGLAAHWDLAAGSEQESNELCLVNAK